MEAADQLLNLLNVDFANMIWKEYLRSDLVEQISFSSGFQPINKNCRCGQGNFILNIIEVLTPLRLEPNKATECLTESS